MKRNRNRPGVVDSIVRDALDRFPNVASKTLADKLHAENPAVFRSPEHARGALRHVRGARGAAARRSISDKRHVIPPRAPGEVMHRLPRGKRALPGWKPVQIGDARTLVLSDVHVPFHDDLALSAAVEAGRQADVDTVILNGDFMDAFACSFFRKDPRQIDFAGEIRTGKQVLRWLREQFPTARMIFKYGNHDERLEHYLIDRAPVLLDLEVVGWSQLLGFDELNIETVRDKMPIRLGKLNVLHGHEYRFIFSPVNVARGLFLRANAHALCGHLHKNSHHAESNLEGKIVSTWSTGCLCDLRPEYDPLAKWQHGAAIVESSRSGAFEVTPLRIFKGRIFR